MKHHLLMTTAAVAGLAAAMVVLPSISAAQAPPMGGRYTNVIAIPARHTPTKTVAAALFKPEGAGPYPAVVYMSECWGLNDAVDAAQQKAVVDHNLGQGRAVLILNSFTPRGFDTGVCDRVGDTSVYANRADDAYAAYRVLAEMPEIDARRVFLQGYGNGAIAATMAVDPNVADNHGGGVFAGVVAYYPYCMNDMKVSAPTLIVVGDRDEATPSTLCAGLKDRPISRWWSSRGRHTDSRCRWTGLSSFADTPWPTTRMRRRTPRRAPTPSSPRT